MTPRRMSNPLEKPTYIVYVYYGVGNYPAEGAPGLVARRDNGRGPYFGRNFSSPQVRGSLWACPFPVGVPPPGFAISNLRLHA